MNAIAARHHLERHHQGLARRVPIEADLGAIDRNARERIVEVDDESLLRHDPAVDHLRLAVGPDIGADATRQRQVGLVVALRPSRIASIRSLAGTFCVSMSMMRRPCWVGVIVARISQGRSAPSEPTVKAMPPPFGRVTLRSILVNVHCLPLR